MGISSTTGLATGIDTEGIVTKLLDVERQPVTLLQSQQQTLATKKTALSAFSKSCLGCSSLRLGASSTGAAGAGSNESSTAWCCCAGGATRGGATCEKTLGAGASCVACTA